MTKKIIKKRIRYCFSNDSKQLAKIGGRDVDFYKNYLIEGKGLMCNAGYVLYYPMINGARIEDIKVQSTDEDVQHQLIEKLESHIIEQGLHEIQVLVAEDNLETQLFFKQVGYFCTNIIESKSKTSYLFIKTV